VRARSQPHASGSAGSVVALGTPPTVRRLDPSYKPRQEECYLCGRLIMRFRTYGPGGVIWLLRDFLTGHDHNCKPQPIEVALMRILGRNGT